MPRNKGSITIKREGYEIEVCPEEVKALSKATLGEKISMDMFRAISLVKKHIGGSIVHAYNHGLE